MNKIDETRHGAQVRERRRKALMEHFRSMDHNRLVSFLNCWLTHSEVKRLCDSEEVKVDYTKTITT